jgi:hypothetical protein
MELQDGRVARSRKIKKKFLRPRNFDLIFLFLGLKRLIN